MLDQTPGAEDEVEEFRGRIDELFEEFKSRRTRSATRQWGLFIARHPSDPDPA
ncbi:hypothetical protein [Brevibacterium aurantiacum]|uniref:hypothetical protein n=1 Tax=Brevibacterium aurantiacum TaxID=273384 RepID=UPI0015E0ADC3|nr:hypothetical protein [Brevibacterium aurantiacum]